MRQEVGDAKLFKGAKVLRLHTATQQPQRLLRDHGSKLIIRGLLLLSDARRKERRHGNDSDRQNEDGQQQFDK